MKRYHPDKHGIMVEGIQKELINEICRVTNLIYDRLIDL